VKHNYTRQINNNTLICLSKQGSKKPGFF